MRLSRQASQRPQRHKISASGMTAEFGKRERRDIDPRERRRAGAKRMHNCRAHDRGVRDRKRRAFARQGLREPGADPLDQGRKRLAPWGAAAGSPSQAVNPSGSRSATSFEARPRQRP